MLLLLLVCCRSLLLLLFFCCDVVWAPRILQSLPRTASSQTPPPASSHHLLAVSRPHLPTISSHHFLPSPPCRHHPRISLLPSFTHASSHYFPPSPRHHHPPHPPITSTHHFMADVTPASSRHFVHHFFPSLPRRRHHPRTLHYFFPSSSQTSPPHSSSLDPQPRLPYLPMSDYFANLPTPNSILDYYLPLVRCSTSQESHCIIRCLRAVIPFMHWLLLARSLNMMLLYSCNIASGR
jgi:hypothetical protein